MFELRFFEIYRSEEFVNLLIEGILVSTGLTISAGIFGFIIAFILAAAIYWKIFALSFISTCYVDFIRNTPLIVQLFFITFGLPTLIGYIWPFWCHAMLALTINFSGYFAEILRSGYESIPRGQLEAASALNLNKKIIFKKIILPQTIIKMFPSLSSQFIFIFLTTGVISEIGVTELTHAGLFIDSRTFRSFEIFIVLTILYIILSLIYKSTLELFFKNTLGKRGS